MENKERAKEFMEKKFHNPDWWTSGEYADAPNKKSSKQHLDSLNTILQRAKEIRAKRV